jgi:hypothetical protein
MDTIEEIEIFHLLRHCFPTPHHRKEDYGKNYTSYLLQQAYYSQNTDIIVLL